MVDLLKELKQQYAAVGVRADFEAEGTRFEELLRLKEISMSAGLKFALKIGGCESIRDMLESRTVGVDCLAAPIVESAYALQKYLQAVDKIFPFEERKNLEIICNIETITAKDNFDEMLSIPEISFLQGVVIERVDMCRSLGMHEDSVNDPQVNQIVLDIIEKARKKGLLCTISGGVSQESLSFFRSIPKGFLHRYETHKVSFDFVKALAHAPEEGILKGLAFEFLWLENKLSYYKGISLGDKHRMELIQQRYGRAIELLGHKVG